MDWKIKQNARSCLWTGDCFRKRVLERKTVQLLISDLLQIKWPGDENESKNKGMVQKLTFNFTFYFLFIILFNFPIIPCQTRQSPLDDHLFLHDTIPSSRTGLFNSDFIWIRFPNYKHVEPYFPLGSLTEGSWNIWIKTSEDSMSEYIH